MNILHKLKGYRSVLVGLAFLLLPLLDYITNNGVMEMLLNDPEKQRIASVVVGIIMIVLRTVTTTPILNQEPKEEADKPVEEQ